jgi:hAT family C-terminal dimerisation region
VRRNELEEYLALPVEHVKDPVKWWYVNRKAYPNLSQMALDYLSIPGEYPI